MNTILYCFNCDRGAYIGITREDRYSHRKSGHKDKYGKILMFPLMKFKDRKDALIVEKRLTEIIGLENLLNKIHGGGTGAVGWIHSKEAKEKISIFNKGKKILEETRKKLRKFNLGRKHSEESIRKRSESNKGIVKTKEHREKLSKAIIGCRFNIDRRKNISEGLKGRTLSLDHRRSISKTLKGIERSEEFKRKVFEGLKSYYRNMKGR